MNVLERESTTPTPVYRGTVYRNGVALEGHPAGLAPVKAHPSGPHVGRAKVQAVAR